MGESSGILLVSVLRRSFDEVSSSSLEIRLCMLHGESILGSFFSFKTPDRSRGMSCIAELHL